MKNLINKLWSTENVPEKCIHSSVMLKSSEASVEELFKHIYDTNKFRSWINMLPFVWLKFDKEQHEVGCRATAYFTLPPFSYRMKVVRVVENQLIELEADGGLMKGRAMLKFTETEEGVLYEAPHWLKGVNKFVDWYYWKLLAPVHTPYMNFRFKKLKGNVMYEKGRK